MLQFLCIASANAEQKINSGLMGPSTSTNPYLVPVDDSISFVSILSAGDRVGYKKRWYAMENGWNSRRFGRL